MPGLTRTQKYAGLREQLANDKEEKIASNDLSQYENRLNNVQDTLSFAKQEIKEEPIIEEVKNEEPEYSWKPFEGDSFSQAVKPIEEVPVEDIPVVEETPVIEEQKQESSFFDSFINNVEEEKPASDFKSYFENENTNKDVFNDVSDDSGEIVSQKERDTYLNQTLTDVFSYNEQSGEDTINTILENSVDEVRHPEVKAEESEPVYEQPAEEAIDNTYWQPFEEGQELDADKIEEVASQADDEEFSNTVSMEITKIMDELAKTPEPVVEEATPEVHEEPVVEEIQAEETIQINETITEERPEEVVEIKNIAEVEKEEKQKETMSNTIPFVVNTDEEELEEDDEEDGSNTVLNVILIVLIVVLVAVLGLIVFYILKTKGIF